MRVFLYCFLFSFMFITHIFPSAMEDTFSSSGEEKTAILSRLMAMNPNIPEEYRNEVTALAHERNRRAMDVFHALKARDIDGSIDVSQKNLLKHAHSVFQQIGEALNIPEKDYAHLLRCVEDSVPYLSLDTMHKMFKDAKAPSDFMSVLPKLAYTALNAKFVGCDLTNVEKNGVAGDCFYLLTRYWEHHAQNLYLWLKDMRLLPCHRQYKEECDELMTMEGKRNALSFFVDALPSMEVTANWALYRLPKSDHRRAHLTDIHDRVWWHLDTIHYYTQYTVPQQPQLGELLSFGQGLMEYSKKLNVHHQPMTRDHLYFVFNEFLYGLQHGVIDDNDIHPYLTWIKPQASVSYASLRAIGQEIIAENQNIYNTEYAPLFHNLSQEFLRLKQQKMLSDVMEMTDEEDNNEDNESV